MGAMPHVLGANENLPKSVLSFSIWILRIKLGSSGSAEALLPTESSHQPYYGNDSSPGPNRE